MQSFKRKPRSARRTLSTIAAIVVALVAVKGVAVYFYWQSLKPTPQYSLALLVDAARNDDKKAVAELVDSDAVVDAMLPQVVEKAIELYGRGVAPDVITRVMAAAAPLVPAVKEVVRPEVPKLIRRESERVGDIPFPLMVVGADRYINIEIVGDRATIRSRDAENMTEVTMARTGDRWKVASVRDEKFARQIAQRVGQQILALTDGRNSRDIDSLIDRLKRETQTQ